MRKNNKLINEFVHIKWIYAIYRLLFI